MVSLRCCIVPVCQIHEDENAGSLCWPMSYTHTSKLAQCMCDRGVTWFPAWCLTSRSSCPTYSYASPSYANPMQDLPCAATRGVDHASKMTNASTTSTSATWTVELEVEEGTCRILVCYQFIWRPMCILLTKTQLHSTASAWWVMSVYCSEHYRGHIHATRFCFILLVTMVLLAHWHQKEKGCSNFFAITFANLVVWFW